MTNRAKLPGLPRVATQDQALNRWITAVAERLEVREGSRGDPGERAVTVKELQTLTRNAVKVVGGELVASGALTGSADPTADPNFVARLEEAIRNTRLYQGLVKRLDDPSRFDDLATEVRQALASSIAQEALSRGADIRRVETKIQQSDRSLAMAVEELTAAIGTSAAGIREVKSAFATADRAQAAKVTQLEARLDIPIADADKLPLPPAAPYASLAALTTAVPKGVTGKYYRVAGVEAGAPELLYAWNGKDYLLAGEGTNAKLEEVMKVTADRVTGAESEYSMKVEATTGGVTAVAGFGLSAAVDPSGSKTSAFIVRADKFAVIAPGDTSDADRYPFGVDANGVFINGTLRINSGGKTAEELANDFYLTATGQVFTQNPNTDTLTPASVTLTAVRKGTIVTGGTLTFASSPAGLLSVSGNTATIQSSAFAANSSVKVTATLTHNNATYTDEFTLYKVTGGADALVGFLTNESHALPASADGVVSSYTGAGGDFTVFKGSTKLTSGVTYSVASNPQSLTVSINSATGAYSMTGGLDVDLATVTFRATIGAQTIDKVFTLTRSKAGAAGTSGNYTDYVFIRSDSTPGTPTATSGIPAGWSDTPPTTGTGLLYMSKAVKKADGTVVGSWSAPARLDGKIGADGKYTEYQYAVGATAPAADATTWGASPTTPDAGQFLWMRSRVVDPAAPLPDWGAAVRISGEKGDPGASAKGLYLSATSQVFQISKAGTASPASITFTATGQNLAGSPTFTPPSGVTLTGTGTTRTLAYTGLTTDTATVKVTWDGLEDTITVAKIREGADGSAGANAITIIVSNEAHTLPASSAGAVSSYTGSGTTVTVYEGTTALTASATATTSAFRVGDITQSPESTITPGEVTYSGTTATVADHSGMVNSTDSVVLTIPITVYRADSTSATFNKLQTITKAKAGLKGDTSTTPGPEGKRGTIVTKLDITVAQWTATQGAAAIKTVADSNGATPNTPIKGDIVHLTDGAKECTAAGDPGTWGNVTAYFSGSLIAGGTVVAGVSFLSGGYFNGSGEGTGGTAKVKNTGTSETSVSYTGQFISSKTNGPSAGVIGKLNSNSVVDGAGVYGEAKTANTSGAGVIGCGYYGVVGKALSSASGSVGVYAEASVSGGTALSVSGPSKFTGKIDSTADIATTQNITAGGNITAYHSSDRRLKTNIAQIPDALKKVSLLRGVTYDWTDAYIKAQGGEDGYFIRRRDVGVIAQEVQAVLPEIVAERADGMLAVKYERLVSLLIEAVKELQARVEVLEAK